MSRNGTGRALDAAVTGIVVAASLLLRPAGGEMVQRQRSAHGTIAKETRGGGRQCRRVEVELQAVAGQSVRRRATVELDVLVEALPSGWVLRVLPHSGPPPAVDFAAIASPPYRSVSPLLLSTDFGFRAQDAIGWNPRHFRFAADRTTYGTLEPMYRSITGAAKPSASDEAALARVVGKAPEGTLEILDARLVPGAADQGRAAQGVSSHFSATAHTVEQPTLGERGSALGRIRAVSLRVTLDLPPGAKAVPATGARALPVPCPER